MTTQRKLAAILSADAAGYSRLMADDEAATLRILNESREVFRKRIEAHGGRLIDTAGDSILAEFPSAVEAVDCADEIQREQRPDRRNRGIRIGPILVDVIDSNPEEGERATEAAEVRKGGAMAVRGKRTRRNLQRPATMRSDAVSHCRSCSRWERAHTNRRRTD